MSISGGGKHRGNEARVGRALEQAGPKRGQRKERERGGAAGERGKGEEAGQGAITQLREVGPMGICNCQESDEEGDTKR